MSSLIYVLLQNFKILTIRNTYVGTLNSHEIDIIEYAIVLQFFESDDIYMTSIYNFAQDLPALPAANKTLARRKRANHDSRDTSIYCYVRTSVRANLVCQIEDSS